MGFRLCTGVKNSAPVSRFVFEVHSEKDARSLFAHMMSVEGFQLIDPFHSDPVSLEYSRAHPTEKSAPITQLRCFRILLAGCIV
jgi:hypothetical protein